MKSPYELRASDGDEEGGTTPSDDEDEGDDKSDDMVMMTTTMMVDMVMMIAAPIVMTTAIEVMIACTAEMIGMNPLVKEKMKMQTYSMRNMTVMWTTIIKILKMILKPTGEAILIVINTC